MCYANRRVGLGALMIQLPSTFGFLTSFSLFPFRLISPRPRRPGLTRRATDGIKYSAVCEIERFFFYCGVAEGSGLLGCCAVLTSTQLPAFPRTVDPSWTA